ncbi:MAG: hypothetical protein PG977_000370 [Bartonella clarridgeiae]|nr:MAG: hypothetical protein PG977_000370 [Bartonella clarridgeiae]
MILWMKRRLMITVAALAAFLISVTRAFYFGKRVEQQKQKNRK